MSDPADRRPIASRNTAFARRITGFLVRRNLTPNAISMLSMAAAAVAGLAFACAGGHWAGLILAALACQMRLLCNLFDGLVADLSLAVRDTAALLRDHPPRAGGGGE